MDTKYIAIAGKNRVAQHNHDHSTGLYIIIKHLVARVPMSICKHRALLCHCMANQYGSEMALYWWAKIRHAFNSTPDNTPISFI